MIWAVLALVLLFLMLRFPAFGGTVLFATAAAGAYFYAESERAAHNLAKRDAEARSFERLKALSLSASTLALDTISSKIEGLASNASTFETIEGFEIKILVYDCPSRTAEGAKCTVVGEAVEHISTNIPPMQKRAYSAFTNFRDLPKVKPGEWSWNLIIRAVYLR